MSNLPDPWEMPSKVKHDKSLSVKDFYELTDEMEDKFDIVVPAKFIVPISSESASIMRYCLERSDPQIYEEWVEQIETRTAQQGIDT